MLWHKESGKPAGHISGSVIRDMNLPRGNMASHVDVGGKGGAESA